MNRYERVAAGFLICLTSIVAEAGPVTQPTSQPAPKQTNAYFMTKHAEFLKRAEEGPIDLLFLGDSITGGWLKAPEQWKAFEKYQTANFGIGGDRVQDVEWRIGPGGELEGLHPKVVVLLLGTNNLYHETPDEIAASDGRIVATIRQKSPQSKVLLMAVLPRGAKGDSLFKPTGPERVKLVNERLAKLDDGTNVRYLDIGPKLAPDGKVTEEIYKDGVHLTPKGYQIWVDEMTPLLTQMMQ